MRTFICLYIFIGPTDTPDPSHADSVKKRKERERRNERRGRKEKSVHMTFNHHVVAHRKPARVLIGITLNL